MASVIKRKSGWYVQVRRKGFPSVNKTLATKAEALRWARVQEALLDAGVPDERQSPKLSLADILTRYRLVVTPQKRSAASESYRLAKLEASQMAALLDG